MSRQVWIRTRLVGWSLLLFWFVLYELNLFLPLLGAAALFRRAREEKRSALLLSALCLLGIVVSQAVQRLPFQMHFREMKARYHADFYDRIGRETNPGSIVFVRYSRWHNGDLDLINNEPDLAKSDRIYVYDAGGEANRSFIDRFAPERTPYFYDEGMRRVTPGVGP